MRYDKVKIHDGICSNLNSIYKAKNKDYGDSFTQTRQEYRFAIIIRLMDKLERLKTLYRLGTNEVDESIDDTLIDLANYAIMELVERQIENEKGEIEDER